MLNDDKYTLSEEEERVSKSLIEDISCKVLNTKEANIEEFKSYISNYDRETQEKILLESFFKELDSNREVLLSRNPEERQFRLFSLLTRVACYAVAISLTERGILEGNSESKFNLFESENKMKDVIRMGQEYVPTIDIALDKFKESVRAKVETQVAKLKESPMTKLSRDGNKIVINEWNDIEDKYAEVLTKGEIIDYATNVLEVDLEREEDGDLKRDWNRAKFGLASERAFSNIQNREMAESVLREQGKVFLDDVRYIFDKYPEFGESLSSEEQRSVIKSLIEIRNNCIKKDRESYSSPDMREMLVLSLLKSVEIANTAVIELQKSEKILKAEQILEEFSMSQKELFEEDFCSTNGVSEIKDYVEKQINANLPIEVFIPVCPTRWPKRLITESTRKKSFFDSNIVLTDATVLMPVTQELARRFKEIGVPIKVNYQIFATDESDYIRIPEIDPWQKNEAERKLLYQDLKAFQKNFNMFAKASLGNSLGICDLNISEPSYQKSMKEEIDVYAEKLRTQSQTDEVLSWILDKISISRLNSFKPEGFYSCVSSEVTSEMAKRIAERQLATYRLQFKFLASKGIAVDNGNAEKARMLFLAEDKNTRIMNIYPCPSMRNQIPNLYRPKL